MENSKGEDGKIKVLMVDDDIDLLEQGELFLKRENKTIVTETTNTPRKALEKLDRNHYDCIVSDYQMPDIDGLKLLQKIREERNSDIPFIIFTGKGREEVAINALNLGADRYLQKGGDPKSQYGVLAQAIDQEVEHREAQEEIKSLSKYPGENPEPVLRVSSDGEILYSNNAGKKLLSKWEVEIEDEIPEDWLNLIKKAFNDGESRFKEVEVGEKVYSLTINPVQKESYANLYGADITERIKAEKNQKEVLGDKERIMDSVPDIIYQLDGKGKIIEWNTKFLEVSGYSSQELEGMQFIDFFPNEQGEKISESVETAFQEGFAQFEASFLTKSGEKIPYSFTATPIKSQDGETAGLTGVGRDTSKRKEKEKELKKGRRKYRHLFNSIRDAILVTDTNRKIIDCNPAFTDLFGYKLEDIKGKKTNYIYHDPEQFEEMGDEIRNHMGDRNFYYTIDYEKKSGEVFSGETNAFYLKDEEGEIKGFIGLIRDISEREEREEELQRERKRFQKIFNNVNDAIYLHSLDEDGMLGEFLEVNDVACEMLGYSREELLNMTPEEINYSNKSGKIPKVVDELLQKGDVRFDIKHQAKDGTKIPVEIYSHLFELEGEKRILSVARNITERKEAEKKLKKSKEEYEELSEEFELILDHIPGLIFFKDTENNFIRVNKRLAEAHNMSKEELEGMSLFDLYSEEEAQEYWEDDKKVIENEEPKLNIVEPWTTEEGTRWMETSKIPYVVNGEVKGIIGISMDITERKKLEEREEFLHSLLRHDVRNKIQLMLGYKELLKDFDLPDNAEKYISKDRKSTEEALEIIEKVSNLREAQEEEIKEVSIEKAIKESINQAKPMAEEKGIEIEAECPKEKSNVLAGDLLNRVFSNIIENSIQHSQGTKIKIHGEETDDNITCIIEDNGVGVSEDKKEEIFERGYTTDEERGTGLGLFLVKTLIDIYEGKIEIKDSELGGTRFDIHLKKA